MRTVLDIGCGFGSFSAHLLSLNLMALCVAAYGSSGSHVQVALERGLPAVIGNFISKQLPFPSLSYDMVHCAQCGVIWDSKGIAIAFQKLYFPYLFLIIVLCDLTDFPPVFIKILFH